MGTIRIAARALILHKQRLLLTRCERQGIPIISRPEVAKRSERPSRRRWLVSVARRSGLKSRWDGSSLYATTFRPRGASPTCQKSGIKWNIFLSVAFPTTTAPSRAWRPIRARWPWSGWISKAYRGSKSIRLGLGRYLVRRASPLSLFIGEIGAECSGLASAFQCFFHSVKDFRKQRT